MQPVTLAFSKGDDQYVLRYYPTAPQRAFYALLKWAQNPELNLNIHDARVFARVVQETERVA